MSDLGGGEDGGHGRGFASNFWLRGGSARGVTSRGSSRGLHTSPNPYRRGSLTGSGGVSSRGVTGLGSSTHSSPNPGRLDSSRGKGSDSSSCSSGFHTSPNPWRRDSVTRGSGDCCLGLGSSTHMKGSGSDSDSWKGSDSDSWIIDESSSGVVGKGSASESWIRTGSGGSGSYTQRTRGGGLRERKKVRLSALIHNYYTEAVKIKRSSEPAWFRKAQKASVDIGELVKTAKGKGLFAHTEFEYSVFLLGSRSLFPRNPRVESLTKELYNDGFIKVQHGVFATINRNRTAKLEDDKNFILNYAEQCLKVAEDLAILFNNKPDMRMKIRQQWMESNSNGLPHKGGKFSAAALLIECKFLISEYMKHAPSLGLSVEEYVDFTSTLFDHCDPNFRDIHHTQNYAFTITPHNSLSKLSLDNSLSKDTMTARLLSLPGPNAPIPHKVISQCNIPHRLCILTEIRYLFVWEEGNLVSYVPFMVDFRLDSCENPNEDHSYSYLTQQDRVDLQKAIISDPSCGFYELKQPKQQDQQPNRQDQPEDEINDGFQKVVRKGKGKLYQV